MLNEKPRRHLQLALFGPAENVGGQLGRWGELDDGVADGVSAAASLAASRAQMDEVVASFPPEEQTEALWGLYMDGAGQWRTRHGLLHVV